MSVSISNYETIESLYNRLRADKTSQHVMFDPIPQYGRVEFTSKMGQRVIGGVTAKDQWNYLNFRLSINPTPIKDILNILKSLKVEHGTKPVLFQLALIPNESKKSDTCHKINTTPELSFYSTDMNPYNKFAAEFEKVRQILGEDQDIVQAWLKKKCPKDVEIFLIGTHLYVGILDLLTARPSIGNYIGWKNIFFNQDPTIPTIYTCKLSLDKLNLIFGNNVDHKSMAQFVELLATFDSTKVDGKKEVTPTPVDSDDESDGPNSDVDSDDE